jgi:hypothetical protein
MFSAITFLHMPKYPPSSYFCQEQVSHLVQSVASVQWTQILFRAEPGNILLSMAILSPPACFGVGVGIGVAIGVAIGLEVIAFLRSISLWRFRIPIPIAIPLPIPIPRAAPISRAFEALIGCLDYRPCTQMCAKYCFDKGRQSMG